MKRQLLTTV